MKARKVGQLCAACCFLPHACLPAHALGRWYSLCCMLALSWHPHSPPPVSQKFSLLGSTGSIGTQTLDIVAEHPDKFAVTALAAGSNIELLAEQVRLDACPPACLPACQCGQHL